MIINENCECCKALEEKIKKFKEKSEIWFKVLGELCKVIERKEEEIKRKNKAIEEIKYFFKNDKKFARYDGYPMIFCIDALNEIEKILKEECLNE